LKFIRPETIVHKPKEITKIVGIVLGAMGRTRDDESTMATAGLVIGIIGILLWIGIIIILIFMLSILLSYKQPY